MDCPYKEKGKEREKERTGYSSRVRGKKEKKVIPSFLSSFPSFPPFKICNCHRIASGRSDLAIGREEGRMNGKEGNGKRDGEGKGEGKGKGEREGLQMVSTIQCPSRVDHIF